jgi:cytochrome c oxidase cbb3-type subunit III
MRTRIVAPAPCLHGFLAGLGRTPRACHPERSPAKQGGVEGSAVALSPLRASNTRLLNPLVLALICFFLVFAAGCSHAPGYPPSPIPRPSAVTDFATLYGQNCAACHGANGQNGPAIDLANPEYQALVDDATLRKWISNGMPGTEMPAFAQSSGGMLTDAQVNALVAGMRQAWSKPNAFSGVAPPAYAPTGSGNAARGQQAYAARCASCHQSQQDITNPNYLALVGDQALRTIIIAGRPDIGQPDWAHLTSEEKSAAPLSDQDVSDLVAYLGTLRGPAVATAQTNTTSTPSTSAAR